MSVNWAPRFHLMLPRIRSSRTKEIESGQDKTAEPGFLNELCTLLNIPGLMPFSKVNHRLKLTCVFIFMLLKSLKNVLSFFMSILAYLGYSTLYVSVETMYCSPQKHTIIAHHLKINLRKSEKRVVLWIGLCCCNDYTVMKMFIFA